ncbi:MAG: response regulator transcription factor [Lachnospiraceae bacterium]|nr:response regulator transcription factor [Lachnospiraceae bacterium]
MIRILVVEDEKPISNFIQISLRQAGYHIDCAFDGKEALEQLDEERYDLILLDVMLPQIDGFELMDYIAPLEIPVIFLTAKNSIQDRVKGLRMGAEDYIVKPFDVMELLARVEVVLRRYKKAEEQLRLGAIEIDVRSMRVTRGGQEISLTPKEYELLLLFFRNPNTALYRETIYERVWGGELEYGSKTVDLHVQRLRKKLSLEKELQAINKVGYRFEVVK